MHLLSRSLPGLLLWLFAVGCVTHHEPRHAGPVAGHFMAEVEIGSGNGGLALYHERDGKPDPDNFVAIVVDRDADGRTVVFGRDRQNGRDDVLDNTGKIDRARYRHVLDGQRYSLPFDDTTGRLRITHDGATGFFRLAYSVRKMIRGEWADGWVELAPVPGWGNPRGRFYAGSLPHLNGFTIFTDLRITPQSVRDRDDRKTGFKVTRRPYTWSGVTGDAVVVTFDHDAFPFARDGRKFVFWSAANYVPAWHLSAELLYSYEFVETWGGGNAGCHEPMSDRLHRWSRVDVIVDNDVRKVVRWRYVLCNSDYKVPDDALGEQLPEVEETWTFYPDGTAVRHIAYFPKLDAPFRNWHELAELIVIAGTRSTPAQHLAEPALTMFDLAGHRATYHPNRAFDKDAINAWREFVSVAHFRDAPDAFCVFSNGPDLPERLRPYPVRFDLSWHGTGYQMAHWPVGLEPYQEPDKTHATWPAQVSHTSLIGAGVWDGTDWTDRFEVDARDRRFRQWVSLVGLHEPGDADGIAARAQAWLNAGTVTMRDDAARFLGVDHARREMRFEVREDAISAGRGVRFALDTSGHGRPVANPVFAISSWGQRPIGVTLNGRTLSAGTEYRVAYEGGAAIVWLNATVSGTADVAITF
jgi:hypothetical protein